MASARTTFKNQENQLFQSPYYTAELNNPGYTTAEKNAINSASNQAIGGTSGAAQTLAKQNAALTGNAAGLTTALERMQQERGRQAAEAAANNAAGIAKARLQSTENALAGIGENQRYALGQEGQQARSGFWNNFTSALGKGLAVGMGK